MPCICLPLSEIDKQERLAACSERSDQASPQVRGGLEGVEKRKCAAFSSLRPRTKKARSNAAGFFSAEAEALEPVLSQNITQSQMPINNQLITIIIKSKYY